MLRKTLRIIVTRATIRFPKHVFHKRWYSVELERLIGVEAAKNQNIVNAAKDLKTAFEVFQESNFAQSRTLFESSISVLEDELRQYQKDSPLLAVAYNNIAETLRTMYMQQAQQSDGVQQNGSYKYNFKDIFPLFKKSEEIWLAREEKEEFAHEVATLYNNMGLFLMDNPNTLQDAIKMFGKSETMRRKLCEKFPEKTALRGDLSVTLSNLAQCFQRQQKTKLALKFYTEAKEVVCKDQPGHYSYFYIMLLNSIGTCMLGLGKQAEALKTFEEALESMEKQRQQGTAPREEFGLTCLNLATVYFGKNRFKEAESFYRQALHNFDKYLSPFTKTLGSCCTQLALCLKKLQVELQTTDPAKALLLKEEADRLMERSSRIAEHYKQQQQQLAQPQRKPSMFSTLLKAKKE